MAIQAKPVQMSINTELSVGSLKWNLTRQTHARIFFSATITQYNGERSYWNKNEKNQAEEGQQAT
jgi:hypothetical protein